MKSVFRKFVLAIVVCCCSGCAAQRTADEKGDREAQKEVKRTLQLMLS